MNQEHYDNLLKGVQHWNAWVDAQGRGFEAKLEMSYLQDEDLAGANLDNAKMSGVVLSDADLTKASFASVDLSRATIKRAELFWAKLTNANLENANLTSANLQYARMGGANLRHANLSSADMSNANLQACDLEGTFLYGAVLRGADVTTLGLASFHLVVSGLPPKIVDLREVRGLTQEQLDTMSGDSGTLLPDTLRRPDHWPTAPTPAPNMPGTHTNPIKLPPANSALPAKPALKWGDMTSLTPLQVARATAGLLKATTPEPRDTSPASDRFVFLSYNREDRPWVQNLRDKLIQSGISVWWDDDIPFDSHWDDEIEAHLEAAEIVLTVWTDKSTASREVKNEALYAMRNDKLVQVRKGNPKLGPRYEAIQCADLTTWSPQGAHSDFDRLVDTLHRRLGT